MNCANGILLLTLQLLNLTYNETTHAIASIAVASLRLGPPFCVACVAYSACMCSNYIAIPHA